MAFSFLYGMSEQTNHNEGTMIVLRDEVGNNRAIAFLQTCPRLLELIDQRPVVLHLTIE